MSTSFKVHQVKIPYGKEELILQTGRLAKQADGSVTVQYGGTVVLVSVVISKEPKEEANFLPLTVEYQEKTYAAGKIPGGFFKREGRPSEKEILTSRLIDRPIRPLFPKGFFHEVQVMALVLSHDGANDPDVLSIMGASAALGVACPVIPHRVGACRVGQVNGNFVLNPTYAEVEQGGLDLVVASTKDGVIMVEARSQEVAEDRIIEAIRFGDRNNQESIHLQEELLSACGVSQRQFVIHQTDPQLIQKVRHLAEGRLNEILRSQAEKEQASEEKKTLVKELTEQLAASGASSSAGAAGLTATAPSLAARPPAAKLSEATPALSELEVEEALDLIEREVVRRMILEEGRRLDGRDLSSVRPISCEVGVLPRTHGSGLFSRGQTQSLASATLGTSEDEQMIDALSGKTFKSFMLHYSFPPFSVGEIRPVRGPGRREIGHGALAERALRGVMPSKEEFPYTVRVVSEILESNGSSSMATVCGGTLALMDAGVPIKSPVSGIAMGLLKEGERHAILTDIIGLEDHLGDMDFKVAGTDQGITALQLDLKLPGISVEILSEALLKAKPARAFVLKKMREAIPAPRKELSAYAPRITVLKIKPEKIGELIGPGGKMIRKITQDSGATVNVEDDGTVMVASPDPSASQKAIDMIKGLTEEAEVGKVYQGVVTRITNFGAFCEIAPGKEGLCHVSELSDQFVPKVEDVVKVGDTLAVKVVEIDPMGRINLSHKQALMPPGTPPVPPRRPTHRVAAREGGRIHPGRPAPSRHGAFREAGRRPYEYREPGREHRRGIERHGERRGPPPHRRGAFHRREESSR